KSLEVGRDQAARHDAAPERTEFAGADRPPKTEFSADWQADPLAILSFDHLHPDLPLCSPVGPYSELRQTSLHRALHHMSRAEIGLRETPFLDLFSSQIETSEPPQERGKITESNKQAFVIIDVTFGDNMVYGFTKPICKVE